MIKLLKESAIEFADMSKAFSSLVKQQIGSKLLLNSLLTGIDSKIHNRNNEVLKIDCEDLHDLIMALHVVQHNPSVHITINILCKNLEHQLDSDSSKLNQE